MYDFRWGEALPTTSRSTPNDWRFTWLLGFQQSRSASSRVFEKRQGPFDVDHPAAAVRAGSTRRGWCGSTGHRMEGGIIVSVNPRWVGLWTTGCLEVEVIVMTFDKVLKNVEDFLTNQFHEFRLGCVWECGNLFLSPATLKSYLNLLKLIERPPKPKVL